LEASGEDPGAASIVSTGAIIGVVVGTLIVVILVFWVVCSTCRSKRRESLSEAFLLELDSAGADVI
jgi:Flp pilus assembly protein TadB